MLALLFSASLSSTVPTPADVLLRVQTPAELTRLLLAQAPTQSEEEKNLEADMDRARQHLGHEGTTTEGAAPAVESAPPPPVPVDDQDQTPRKKKKSRRAEADNRFRATSPEGHGKAYYLVWGIVDWNIAGGMWVTAAVLTLYGLAAMSVSSADGCSDQWNSNHTVADCSANARDIRNAGVILTGVGVLFGAGGGLAAWRAADNLGTYKSLKNEERAYRDNGR